MTYIYKLAPIPSKDSVGQRCYIDNCGQLATFKFEELEVGTENVTRVWLCSDCFPVVKKWYETR